MPVVSCANIGRQTEIRSIDLSLPSEEGLRGIRPVNQTGVDVFAYMRPEIRKCSCGERAVRFYASPTLSKIEARCLSHPIVILAKSPWIKATLGEYATLEALYQD